MITVLLVDSIKEEVQELDEHIRKLTAVHTDEQICIIVKPELPAADDKTETVSELNMALIDVTRDSGIDAAKLVRKKYSQVQILVIADLSVSPVMYLNPAIQPSALLLRSGSKQQKIQILEDYFMLAIQPLLSENKEHFWAKTRDGVQKILYRQILYFEAREKKIFIRTLKKEYGIAGTIDSILEKLPDHFARCHRSFIVNMNYVERLRLSDGTIYLPGMITIPVSRSYKAQLKEYSSDRKI